MPLLFCLGQHGALEALQHQLCDGERLLAFLDDIYLATPPFQVGPAYTAVQELWIHAGEQGRQTSHVKRFGENWSRGEPQAVTPMTPDPFTAHPVCG